VHRLAVHESREGALSRKAIIAVIIAAIVVAGVVIGVQQATKKSSNDSSYAKKFTADYPNVQKNLAGIPQNGQVLGKAAAAVKITEYMDYKCPVCGAASNNLVPAVITNYVRTGKASISLDPVHVIPGNQSETGALAGLATAPQNKMWEFTELILRNQGSEVDPWLTSNVLTAAATTAGVDINQWNAAQNGQAVVNQFFNTANNFSADTSAAGVQQATPTFVIKGPKGTRVVQGDVPESQIGQAIAAVSG
jgi:protein-disulfide isomerase